MRRKVRIVRYKLVIARKKILNCEIKTITFLFVSHGERERKNTELNLEFRKKIKMPNGQIEKSQKSNFISHNSDFLRAARNKVTILLYKIKILRKKVRILR